MAQQQPAGLEAGYPQEEGVDEGVDGFFLAGGAAAGGISIPANLQGLSGTGAMLPPLGLPLPPDWFIPGNNIFPAGVDLGNGGEPAFAPPAGSALSLPLPNYLLGPLQELGQPLVNSGSALGASGIPFPPSGIWGLPGLGTGFGWMGLPASLPACQPGLPGSLWAGAGASTAVLASGLPGGIAPSAAGAAPAASQPWLQQQASDVSHQLAFNMLLPAQGASVTEEVPSLQQTNAAAAALPAGTVSQTSSSVGPKRPAAQNGEQHPAKRPAYPQVMLAHNNAPVPINLSAQQYQTYKTVLVKLNTYNSYEVGRWKWRSLEERAERVLDMMWCHENKKFMKVPGGCVSKLGLLTPEGGLPATLLLSRPETGQMWVVPRTDMKLYKDGSLKMSCANALQSMGICPGATLQLKKPSGSAAVYFGLTISCQLPVLSATVAAIIQAGIAVAGTAAVVQGAGAAPSAAAAGAAAVVVQSAGAAPSAAAAEAAAAAVEAGGAGAAAKIAAAGAAAAAEAGGADAVANIAEAGVADVAPIIAAAGAAAAAEAGGAGTSAAVAAIPQ